MQKALKKSRVYQGLENRMEEVLGECELTAWRKEHLVSTGMGSNRTEGQGSVTELGHRFVWGHVTQFRGSKVMYQH